MKNKINNIELQANNLLNELFRTREDSIYNFTDNERKLLSKKSKDYSNIYIAIDNIPDGFVETINGIKKVLKTILKLLMKYKELKKKNFIRKDFQMQFN